MPVKKKPTEEPKKRRGKRAADNPPPTPKAKAKSTPAPACSSPSLEQDLEDLMDSFMENEMESAAAPTSSTGKASVTRTIVPKGYDQPVKQTMTDIFARTRKQPTDSDDASMPTAPVTIVPTETQAEQGENTTVPTEIQVEKDESTAVPTETQVVKVESTTVPTETQAEQGENTTVPTETQVEKDESTAVPTETQAEQGENTMVPTETQVEKDESSTMLQQESSSQSLSASMAHAIEIVKNHHLFGAYLTHLKTELGVDDDFSYGDPHGDPLEDLRSFNQYAIEHWEKPVHFEYDGHDEGSVFFSKSTDQKTTDALLVAARQHASFQTYSETVIKDRNTFGSPQQDALLHINLFNKYLQECSLVPVYLPANDMELFGNDDDMGINTKTAETQLQDSDDDDDDQTGYKYPIPPTAQHPRLQRLLQSAAKIMVKQLIASQTIDVESKLRSLPRTFNLGDFYSGAGTFFLIVEAVVKAFQVVAPDPADDLEMVHHFMSEWIPFKQRHLETLLSALGEDGHCCIFADATKVFGDERECIRHQSSCDLPSELHGYNGGFSCRSFSRLHPDYASLQRALFNDDEDASSVSTFKQCVAALTHCKPDFYILENVELGDVEEPESNARLISEALESAGYSARLFRIMASDFGVPQRRLRVYIAGFSHAKQPQASLVRVEHAVNAMRLQCQRPEDFMLPDDHPAIMSELERRLQIRAKANTKDGKDTGGDTTTTVLGSKRGGGKKSKDPKSKADGKTKGNDRNEETSDSGKWQLAHQQLAESRGIKWPLAVPNDLQGNPWFESLSLRERENMLFLLNERQTLISTGHEPIRYGDLQQSAHRTPTSTAAEVPTILPSSKLMDLERRRLLIGRELLHLQAIQFDPEVRDRLSESQMGDLAGNAFAGTSCMAIFIAMVLELEFRTESESDEEGEVLDLVEKIARHGGIF